MRTQTQKKPHSSTSSVLPQTQISQQTSSDSDDQIDQNIKQNEHNKSNQFNEKSSSISQRFITANDSRFWYSMIVIVITMILSTFFIYSSRKTW